MKIGILETGLPPKDLDQDPRDYPEMFRELLDGNDFEFISWQVVSGQFPDGVDDADGWLITGSRHGVYEDHPWIPRLSDLIQKIYESGKPMIGVCFGHQIIAQALGGKVEKFTGGWSVGPTRYRFGQEEVTLHAWHQDQVIDPPKDAQTIASTDFCAHAALLYPGRAYTVQPHPEYEDVFIKGLIEKRGPGVVPDSQLRDAELALGTKTDNQKLGAQFAHFFKTGKIE